MANVYFSNFAAQSSPALTDNVVGYANTNSGGEIRATLTNILALFQANRFTSVPAASNSSGTAQQMAMDANYFYVCVATNTWRRHPLDDWS